MLCVVCEGQGYWIPVDHPKTFEVVDAIPIKQVLASPEAGLLVLIDNTRLTAYDKSGERWVSGDMSWDGLKDCEIRDGKVRGVGWDSPANRYVPFTVCLRSGDCEGGSSSDAYRAAARPPE